MRKIALIILHYKNTADTIDCLNSLRNDPFIQKESCVIVVGNSPFSNEISTLRKKFSAIHMIQNEENLGFSEGNNCGIHYALAQGCDLCILLNNDTIPAKNTFAQLAQFARDNDTCGLISPKIYFAAGSEYHKDRYEKKELGKVIWYAGGNIDWNNIYAFHRGVDEVDHDQYGVVSDTEFTTGCCMVIKKAVFEKIGFFDPKYFLYFEDVDFSMRAKKAGFRVVYFPSALLWHKNAASSGRPGSALHVYYQTRNRLYFGFQYASLWVKKSLIWDSIKTFSKGGIQQKAILDYYMGRMGKQ